MDAFKPLIAKVATGSTLTRAEAELAFDTMLSGEVTPAQMGGFQHQGGRAFAWAELNARGRDLAIPFYEQVFGWSSKRSRIPNAPDYVEFQVDGESVAGASELMVPVTYCITIAVGV